MSKGQSQQNIRQNRFHQYIDNNNYIKQRFMEEDNHHDKLTQNKRGSYQKPQKFSLFNKIKQNICPCFVTQNLNEQKSSQTLSKNDHRNTIYGGSTDQGCKYSKQRTDGSKLFTSSNGVSLKNISDVNYSLYNPRLKTNEFIRNNSSIVMDSFEENAEFMNKTTIKKWHSYPIYHHKENEFSILGTTKGYMLGVICSVKVQPSIQSRKKTKKSNPFEKYERSYSMSNVDKFWDQRYYLFQKFDEGVSLDNEAWSQVVPQAVAEYLAKKIRCETILDGFCGAGGNSIKFAHTCSRVVANDIDFRKLKCLNNNSKLYSVENIEISNTNFLNYYPIKVDVVFINPSQLNPDCSKVNSLSPQNFNPPLDKIIETALKLSNNLFFLLPANINVNKFIQTISNEYMKTNIPTNTCSVKIQKIFFLSQLRYLAIYFGYQIQHDIKLNDQLTYIYSLLKDDEGTKKKIFKHKILIKRIRQKYGMINLLNYALNCKKIELNISNIQKFIVYIREKNLMKEQQLDNILKEQEIEIEKAMRSRKKKIPLIDDSVLESNFMLNSVMTMNQQEQQISDESTEGKKQSGLGEIEKPERNNEGEIAVFQQIENSEQVEEVQEQKCVAAHDDERTVSYYSMGSGNNRFSIEPKLINGKEDNPHLLLNQENQSHQNSNRTKTKTIQVSLQQARISNTDSNHTHKSFEKHLSPQK